MFCVTVLLVMKKTLNIVDYGYGAPALSLAAVFQTYFFGLMAKNFKEILTCNCILIILILFIFSDLNSGLAFNT